MTRVGPYFSLRVDHVPRNVLSLEITNFSHPGRMILLFVFITIVRTREGHLGGGDQRSEMSIKICTKERWKISTFLQEAKVVFNKCHYC